MSASQQAQRQRRYAAVKICVSASKSVSHYYSHPLIEHGFDEQAVN